MNIQPITIQQLRQMEDQGGLVLQGCGGDLQEWLSGINLMLISAGILKKGTTFQDIYSFQKDGIPCLLFPFQKDVELDMGRLAMWRLKSHASFGSTWLSDYIPIYLGGFEKAQQQKPDCPLIGTNGNVFNLIGIASRTLRENGMMDQAREMWDKITHCQSYDSALSIIGEFVNITGMEEIGEGVEMGVGFSSENAHPIEMIICWRCFDRNQLL